MKSSKIGKCIFTILALLLSLVAEGQSFTSLWKKFDDAKQKDLPRTQMDVLRQIVQKAETERAYGHLLKAEFGLSALQTQISPDSLDVEKVRLVQKAEAAEEPALRAVYASALGRMYSIVGDHREADKWYKRSMEFYERLAGYKDVDFEPLVDIGASSKTFYNDLLHVVGFAAGHFARLAKYYEAHGNRPAAAICNYYDLTKTEPEEAGEARKSKYLQRVDSLLRVYADLKEGGLFAVAHYEYIERCNDVSVEDRINFINYALARWGAWPGINQLRNAQTDLQQPSFNISVGDCMMLPNALRQLRINSIRNISSLTINVYRLRVNGDTELNPADKDDYQQLRKLMDPTPVQTVQRRYYGMAPWQETGDSLSLEGMPVGVYLIEATTDNSNVATQRALLHVSNLYVMHEARPGNEMRFVVVDATTGEPVQGAQVELSWNATAKDKKGKVETLKTDKNGVAICHYESSRPQKLYVYTDDDKACDKFNVSSTFRYYDRTPSAVALEVYTDRAIYRPGQQVEVGAIMFERDHQNQSAAVKAGEQVTLTLRDANGKEVGESQVTTDEYGTAHATLTLPQTGLTGRFVVTANANGRKKSTSIRVEQYKRPTFEVEFEPYKAEYQVGDTLRIKGTARTYSGVAVPGARVAYTVTRRQSSWWARWGRRGSDKLLTDSVMTGDDGSFTVRMPMELPAEEQTQQPGLYAIQVEALVTDQAGETHGAECALPISLKSTFLTVNLPDRAQRDSLRSFSFSRRNMAGEEIDGLVRYRVNGGEWQTAEANTTVAVVKKRIVGQHLLEAICGNDTLTKQITIFSLSDKKPAKQTHDWFYLSATEFPADGKPVYLQVGSSDEVTNVYYSVYSGNTLIAEGRKTLHGEIHTEKINYSKSMGDGILINVAWVHRGHLYSHKAAIARPAPDKQLTLTWQTFRDKLVPGQKEEWTLQVVDQDGKAVQSQLMATLFDKSLDALTAHKWGFSLGLYNNLPSTSWAGGSGRTLGLYGFEPTKWLPTNALSFSSFNDETFSFAQPLMRYYGRPLMRMRSSNIDGLADAEAMPLTANLAVAESDMAADVSYSSKAAMVETATQSDGELSENTSPQIRENLQETAFFYPTLTTDDKGVVSIKFTLPESVTTWHFMGFAHDKQVNYGLIEADAVAQKTVMLQPNMPRFLRSGDMAAISARISNTSENKVGGTARLQLLDPETEKVVVEWSKPFAVEAATTTVVSFNVDAGQVDRQSGGAQLLVARMVAEGRGFSDGEQHYLPLLPDKELITATLPFSQEGAGTKTIDLSKLFPTQDSRNKLTIEYTNHPAWLIVQALPTLANPSDKNAVSLATAIYANSIGQQLLNADPAIGRTIKLWQQEQGGQTSLASQLEKNEELRTMVLAETPWVADAARESEQKHLLSTFLDENIISYRLQEFAQKLTDLQLDNGSFSWWPGMSGNSYMTATVVETLCRLAAMTGERQYDDMLNKAYEYLDKRIAEEVTNLKQLEKKGQKQLAPSELACHYLYSSALYGRQHTSDMRYLLDLLEQKPTDLTIYGKGASAIILAQYGREDRAREYLQSLSEYTVYSEELGRYYDTPHAYYSWMNYKIPTQVMAIEALKALTPSDTKTISEMQRWLLHEKRTTSWETPIAATDAVYAFLTGTDGKVDMSGLTAGNLSVLRLDGQQLEMPTATAGLGYQKTAVSPVKARTFTAEKTSGGTSWGALYAQYWQASTDVESAASGLAVQREVLSADGKPIQGQLHVGDKILVRITITADRDYDFVQVEDKRAACIEPAQQLSGYRYGYYCAPQDNATRYYFDLMAKGKHVVETVYYVDREGQYASGTCTVQCAYSPEYAGREGGKTLQVVK